MMQRNRSRRSGWALRAVLPGGCLLVLLAGLPAQDPGAGPAKPRETPEGKAAELAALKQAEAQEKLKLLEETMDRLARLLAATEPQNAVKLRTAFQASRERLLREGMDQVIQLLREKKWDRAIKDQSGLSEGLDELLAILLEKDIDPRELIRHIRKLRDLLVDLDQVVAEEHAEKVASDEAQAAESAVQDQAAALARLDDLIQEQKEIEKQIGDAAPAASDPDENLRKQAGEKLRKIAPRQKELKEKTTALGKSAPQAGQDSSGSSLDAASLSSAAEAMGGAAKAMESGGEAGAEKAAETAAAKAAEARKHLEAARRDAEEKLERLRAKRDFAAMKKAQDETQRRTEDIRDRMKDSLPLIFSPEGGVPGREDVGKASGSMGEASKSLAGGQSEPAGKSQKQAIDSLEKGREQADAALEELQRALRERLLAYLRERYTTMLERQRKVSLETRSLDARLRALANQPSPASAVGERNSRSELDRRDLQRAEELSRQEGSLALIALDTIDLLQEDGTTLVFPRIVGEVKRDLENVQGLLSRVETGALTQRVQSEIEQALEEILAALVQAQKRPPPPNPNKGRDSKSGSGPLLPASAELKMIRSMQARVNKRTSDFDLERDPQTLSLEEQRQAKTIAERQREIEDLLKKMAQKLGER